MLKEKISCWIRNFLQKLNNKKLLVLPILKKKLSWVITSFLQEIKDLAHGPHHAFLEKLSCWIQPLLAKIKDIALAARIMFLAGLALIIVAVVALFNLMPGYMAKTDYSDDVVIEDDDNDSKVVKLPWYQQCDIDFVALENLSSDVKGWIYFENVDISYPVAKGKDNDKYLHTNLEGDYARGGTIFMEYQNSADFNDALTIIYGHNMKNGTMFGKLKKYKTSADYLEKHQYFQIITNGTKYRYQIFSVENVKDTSEMYQVSKESNKNSQALVEKMKKSTAIKANVVDDADWDHVITLSTCSAKEDERWLVHGVRIDTYEED